MTESDPQLLSSSTNSPPGPSNTSPETRRSSLPLVLLLVAGVAGGGFYLWQQIVQRDSQLLEFSQQVEQNRLQLGQLQQTLVADMERRVTAAQDQLEEGNRLLQQHVAELNLTQEELRQRLDDQQKSLAVLATSNREDWQLAEAEYLLKIANQRLLLERDTYNATALLRSADSLIQQASAGTGEAELFAVRKSLSRDLAALEQITPVDKEGLYLRLHALAVSIDQLPRVAPTRLTAPEPAPDIQEGVEPPTWSERIWRELKAMAGKLDNYIRIDDVEAPAKPLVDSHVAQIAGLNLRLLLEQAQMAVLKADPTIYQQGLTQAQQLLRDYYIDSAEARQLGDKLAELAAVDIAPTLPDISPSLGLLHDYLRQQHQMQPSASKPATPQPATPQPAAPKEQP